MESLHAPWRIEYILSPKPAPSETSLFTRIAQSNDDIAHHVIVRERSCYALLNNYPYNGGHLMVVPYRQVADFEELTDGELLDLTRLMRRCVRALRAVMKPGGFNIGVNLGACAGAGIAEHLHLHIVPRWPGDTNFMPVVGQVTVVPQALAELAAQLRAELQRESGEPPAAPAHPNLVPAVPVPEARAGAGNSIQIPSGSGS
jgi:ATP adenylyltransferase